MFRKRKCFKKIIVLDKGFSEQNVKENVSENKKQMF